MNLLSCFETQQDFLKSALSNNVYQIYVPQCTMHLLQQCWSILPKKRSGIIYCMVLIYSYLGWYIEPYLGVVLACILKYWHWHCVPRKSKPRALQCIATWAKKERTTASLKCSCHAWFSLPKGKRLGDLLESWYKLQPPQATCALCLLSHLDLKNCRRHQIWKCSRPKQNNYWRGE